MPRWITLLVLTLPLVAASLCGQATPPAKPSPVQSSVPPPSVVSGGEKIRQGKARYIVYNSILWVASDGDIKKIDPSDFINLDGVSPIPLPPPPPPTPNVRDIRVARYKNLALAATGDPNRRATAEAMASAYMVVAVKTFPNIEEMGKATQQAGYTSWTTTSATAWQGFRDAITSDWNNIRGIPPEDTVQSRLSELLMDISTGLSASITP